MHKILIVDDSKTVLNQIMILLKESYHAFPAIAGESSFKIMEHQIPDSILLNLMLPIMNGKVFLHKVKEVKTWSDIPVIFLTSDTESRTEAECLNLGAYDFIGKPIVKEVLLSRVEKTLELTDYRKDLQQKPVKKNRQIKPAYLQTMATLAHTIDAKDPDTNGHSHRVAYYTKEITKSMGFNRQDSENTYLIALLHDVGKIGIPDAV